MHIHFPMGPHLAQKGRRGYVPEMLPQGVINSCTISLGMEQLKKEQYQAITSALLWVREVNNIQHTTSMFEETLPFG